MKPFFVIAVFLLSVCFVVPGYGQSEKSPRFTKSIKLTIPVSVIYGIIGVTTGSQTSVSVGFPAPALVLQGKKRHWHEIELNQFGGSKTQAGFRSLNGTAIVTEVRQVNRVSLGGRYQFSFGFSDQDKKFKPFIGAYGQLGFMRQKFNPLEPNQFPFSTNMFSGTIGLVPGLRYQIKGRVFADAGLDIAGFQLLVSSSRNENPSLSLPLQRSSWIDANIPWNDRVGARIAVGFQL